MFFCFSFSKHKRTFSFLIVIVVFISFTFISTVLTARSSVEIINGTPVPILMYHSVCDNKKISSAYLISPTLFEKDLKYLFQNGYNAIFISDLIEFVYNNEPLPDKPIIITLDDGYLNNLTYVLPLLEKYNMKAAVSVVGSYIESFSINRDKNPNYAYLTWDDIKILDDSGRIEIGNHTYSMHDLKSRNGCMKKLYESEEDYTKILSNNLFMLQNALLEKAGVSPVFFTYPFGAISKESLPVIKSLGFKAALTCSEGINYITRDNIEKLYNLKRINRVAGIETESFMKRILPKQ